jgi:UDP-N-acetylmuramoyl-L-alanyl-D-glutamate--2,6-diaminopimelate ligase
MIEEILKCLGQKVGVIGTISNKIGDRVLHTERTTPESLELQEIFKEMVDEGVNSTAMEVSSHALDLDRVYECEFEVGVFTNLTRDHLDFHKTFEAYAKAKAKLFAISKKSVINVDNEYAKYMLEAAKGEIITFGIDKDADVSASNIEIDARGTRYHLKTPSDECDIFLGIPGIFTVYNSLGSIAACLALEIPLKDIKKGIEGIKGVPGRFELVETDTDYSVIVDYAHTPDGLENILNTAKEFANGSIITIFGCGGDRDKTKRPLMGEIAAELSDYCIVTSDNPRSEDPEAIINEIIPGVLKSGTPYQRIIDRKEAIKAALEMAQQSDIIIIAGKGHEDYQILKDKVIHFDDKEVVKELLRGGKN